MFVGLPTGWRSFVLTGGRGLYDSAIKKPNVALLWPAVVLLFVRFVVRVYVCVGGG